MPRRPRLGHECCYVPPEGMRRGEETSWGAIITRIHQGDSVGLVAFPPGKGVETILSCRYGRGPGDWYWPEQEEDDCASHA